MARMYICRVRADLSEMSKKLTLYFQYHSNFMEQIVHILLKQYLICTTFYLTIEIVIFTEFIRVFGYSRYDRVMNVM